MEQSADKCSGSKLISVADRRNKVKASQEVPDEPLAAITRTASE